MQTEFKLNSNDLDLLISKIKQLPGIAEKIINDYLHESGALYAVENIKSEMPVGINDNKKYKGYPRTHAKFSDSLEIINNNLGFAVKTRHNPFFGYLYFPVFAEGTSKNNAKNDFFKEGLEKSREKIVQDLLEILSEKIKEEF